MIETPVKSYDHFAILLCCVPTKPNKILVFNEFKPLVSGSYAAWANPLLESSKTDPLSPSRIESLKKPMSDSLSLLVALKAP